MRNHIDYSWAAFFWGSQQRAETARKVMDCWALPPRCHSTKESRGSLLRSQRCHPTQSAENGEGILIRVSLTTDRKRRTCLQTHTHTHAHTLAHTHLHTRTLLPPHSHASVSRGAGEADLMKIYLPLPRSHEKNADPQCLSGAQNCEAGKEMELICNNPDSLFSSPKAQ